MQYITVVTNGDVFLCYKLTAVIVGAGHRADVLL